MPVRVTSIGGRAPSFIGSATGVQNPAPDVSGFARGVEDIANLLLVQRQRRERSIVARELAGFRSEIAKDFDRRANEYDGSGDGFAAGHLEGFDAAFAKRLESIDNDRIRNALSDAVVEDRLREERNALLYETRKTHEFVLRNAGETAKGILNGVGLDPARGADARNELKALAETLPGALRGGFLEEAYRDSVQAELDGRLRQDPYALQRDLGSGRYNQLATPEQRERAQRSAEVEIRRREAEAERRRSNELLLRAITLKSTIQDDLASVEATGVGVEGLNPDEVREVLGPQEYARYEQRRRVATAAFEATDGIDDLSVAEIETRLESLAPAPGEEGYATKQAIYEGAVKRASAAVRARAADPAAYYAERDGGAQQAFLAYREAQASGDPDQRSLAPRLFEAYAQRIRARQEAGGVPASAQRVLTQGQAKGMAAEVLARPPEERAAAIRDLTASLDAQYGREADAVMAELVEAGLPREAEVLRAFADDPVLADDLARALDARESVKTLVPTADRNDARAAVATSLSPLIDSLSRQADGVEQASLYQDSVAALAEYKVAREGLSPRRAAREAADAVMKNYGFADTFRVPAAYDLGAVERGARESLDALLAGDGAGLSDAVAAGRSPSLRRALYAEHVRANAAWVTTGDERGLYLVDRAGQPVLNAAGEEIRIEFDALEAMGRRGGLLSRLR